MKRMTILFVAAGLSLGCRAATYYVKPDGNDSAAGTSWETALKTPTKGFAKIHNNGVKDTLIIAPGHYLLSDACACNGQTTGDEVRGETGNPEDVILDGQGAREVMRLAGDILVHGLTITNGTNSGRTQYASGVRIGSSSSAGSTVSVVSNCVIAGCYNAYTNGHSHLGGAAFVFSDGRLVNSVVRGNEAVWRGAGVTLIGLAAEARGCVIEQNISTNDGAAGVWGSMNETWQDRNAGRLVDCVVQTNTGNFSTGVTYVRYAEGCTIRGNVILEDTHSASAGTFGGTSGYMVTNCTFEGNCNPGGWAAVNANHTGTFVDTRFIGNISCGRNYNKTDYGAGGLLVNGQNRTVTIDRCVFAGNVVENTSFTGGGIQVLFGTAVVSDCVISNNTAWRGGGIAVNTNGTLRRRGTLLRDNRATTGGGIVLESGAKAYLDGCTFDANAATNSMSGNGNVGGGGIFLYKQTIGGFCSMSNCVFASNTSKERGGGMGHTWCGYAIGEAVNCVFTNNTSVRQGGGLVVREDNSHRHDKPFVVRNSLFAFNKTKGGGGADANGAGIHFVSYNDVVLDSCTVVSNDSGYTMNGGVHHRWSGTITNCVIAFNTVKGNPEPVTTDADSGTQAWIMPASCYQNCCIWPSGASLQNKFTAANGCVNADPLFADAANGDFTLQPNSPCRNAGRLEDWMTDATDLAGSKRVSGKGVDMGCYERFVPAGLYISFR
ncbi:MAG: DUF5123 domain-containing protein [Kiritimatiellae bacterium]|nr:DUF5123 domain-containing protein [Kiritimatiellia bacterium]